MLKHQSDKAPGLQTGSCTLKDILILYLSSLTSQERDPEILVSKIVQSLKKGDISAFFSYNFVIIDCFLCLLKC